MNTKILKKILSMKRIIKRFKNYIQTKKRKKEEIIAYSVTFYHNIAMTLSENGDHNYKYSTFSHKYKNEVSMNLYKQAFIFERKAALYYRDKIDIEPTRSILFKSAAYLAIDAELYEESRKMIYYALIGNPPEETKKELLSLLKKIEKK